MSTTTTILLVEPSRFFLTMEHQFLRTTPASIIEAQTVAQAEALCRRQPPDLIYMDLEMQSGGTGGADFCRRLKADPNLATVPVVLLYDEAHPEQRELCRQAGCDGVLSKPLNRRRFLELGRSLLAGIRERRRPCDAEVRLRSGDGTYTGRALDISSGGLFLTCPEELTPGLPLRLEVQLAGPDGKGPWMLGSGTVAWINTHPDPVRPEHPRGYGIRFTVLSPQSEAVLNGFLKAIDGI